MASDNLTFLSLILIHYLLVTRVSCADYLGCFPEDQKNRQYSINPGDFDPESMTPGLCSAKCGSYDLPYAALTYGSYCFCGNSPPVPGNVVANSFCADLCSGDPTYKCGGKGYVSLFESATPIAGLDVTNDASGVISVSTAVNFVVSITHGRDVYYQMDYDDGAGLSDKNATDFTVRTFYLPGTYSVRVEANNFNDTLPVQKAATSVSVQAPVADVDMECQPVFATYEEGWCVATVWQGTSLSLTATLPSAAITTTFTTIADPVISQVGPGIPSKDEPPTLLTPSHIGTIIAPASLVENPGRVIGWEVNMQSFGTLKVQILSPTCGGQVYCIAENQCLASCASSAGAYAVTCSGQNFCPRKRLCDDTTCADITRFNALNPQVATYTVKAEVDVVTSVTGYQYVAESSLLDVSPGDILAIFLPTTPSTKPYWLDCPADQTNFKQAAAVAVGATVSAGSLTTTSGECFAVRAAISEGSKVYLPYTFTEENDYPLNVAASNKDLSTPDATNSTLIHVLEGVNFTIIDGDAFLKTGVAYTFTILPHTGNGALYTWDQLGDGVSVLVNTTSQSKVFTYPTKGTYNLTATVANAVSSKTNVSIVAVQDEVTGLDVTAPTAAKSEVHNYQITLTGGSDYTCTWTFGDGSSTTTNDTTTPVGSTNVPHTYTTIGDKSFSVTCANAVSTMTKILTQKVQERITGLALSQSGQDSTLHVRVPWQVTTGSDITWNFTFVGASFNVDNTLSNPAGYRWVSEDIGLVAAGIRAVVITGWNDINSETISETYELTTAIADFQVTVSTDNTTTGTNIVFTVGMTKGSDVNVTLIYQDGNQHSQVYAGDWPGTDQTYNHAFTDGGRFFVQITASNAAGTFTEVREIFVLQGCNGIEMFSPDYALYSPPSYIDVWFDVPPGAASPTEPKLVLDFDYKSDPQNIDLELGKNYTEQYDDMGLFNIRATISNALDSKNFFRPLVIIDILEGPQIQPAFPKAPRGQDLDVDFILYRGPKAPYCNLTWESGESGVPDQITQRQGSGQNGKDTNQIQYSTLGTYTLKVTATTPLQTVSHSLSMEVIEPVLDTLLEITPTTGVWSYSDTVVVTVKWTGTYIPHSPLVSIVWGDGVEELNQPFGVTGQNFQKTYQRSFTDDGLMTTTVTVHNDASSVQLPLTMGVYKPFNNLAVSKCFWPDLPVNAACQTGLSGNADLFSNDKSVEFNMITANNAKASYYEITAVNGLNTFVCNRTTNPFPMDFNQTGSWSVTVRAINPKYEATVVTTVDIVEKIVGFDLSHNESQKDAGAAKDFYIEFTIQGTATCLFVEFGDGSKAMYADNAGDCTGMPTFTGMTTSGVLTGQSYISHTYLDQSTFKVVATAKNLYTTITKTLNVEITGLDCSQPEVKIYNATTNFKTPHHYKRGAYTTIRGIPRIACSVNENVKSWVVETVDPAWGNVTGVVDLAASDVITETAELNLKPWILAYGLYKVTFSMSMVSGNPNITFTASEYSYFEVGESDLVGLMVDGGSSEIVRGTGGGALLLQPLLYSYDPDVLNNDPATSGISVVNWTCTFKNGSTDATTASLNPGPGVSTLNHAVSSLLVSHIYRIKVFLQKGSRTVEASVDVVVVSGSPPNIAIKCVANSICGQQASGYLALKSARLSLQAECQNCATTDDLSYLWTIYLSAYRWKDGWRPLQPLDLAFNRTVGNTSQKISMQPSLFNEFTTFNLYKAECRVSRNGVEGWAATEILLNEPPKGGSCTIEPKSMVVTPEKLFHIQCADWSDDSGIEEFRFYSFFDNQTVITQITTVKTPQGSVDINVTLAQGPEYLNFNNTVRVAVIDTLGARTDIAIDVVQVTPIPSNDSRAMVEAILNNPTSELQTVFAEGDVVRAAEYATTIAAILTSDSKQSETEYAGRGISSTKTASGLGPADSTRVGGLQEPTITPTTEEQRAIDNQRDNRGRVRDLIVDSVIGLPNNTLESKILIMSAVAEVINVPDEVTSQSQLRVMDMLEKFSEDLDSGKEVAPEERLLAMNYLFSCVGAVTDAAGTTGFDGTLSTLEAASQDVLFLDYPTENVAEFDDCITNQLPANMDAALKQQKQQTNCRLQRGVAEQVAQSTRRVMNSIRKSFLKNSIEGESQQFNTDRMRSKLTKASAKKAFQSMELEHSKAGVEFPENFNDIFPPGTVGENDTLLLQVNENSDNMHRYSTLSKDIPKTTRFVTISVFSENGSVIPIANTAKPLLIKIPRGPATATVNTSTIDPMLTNWNKFQLHKTKLSNKGSSLHAELCLMNASVQYLVVIGLGAAPDPPVGMCNKTFLVPPSMADPVRPHCTTIVMNNYEVNGYTGDAFLGVRQLDDNEIDMDVSNCSQLPDWSAGADNATQFTGNYTLKLFSSACYVMSDTDADWSTDSCQVHESTNEIETVCSCTHLTTFAGGWVVVPNTIDWAYVFSNADFFKNPTLYVTEIVIILVYIVAFIWARRKDKKDVEQLGIAPLLDNDPKDRYYYEIVVVTGMRRNAGTDSKVFFILSGEDDETDVRQFSDSKRKIFRRGNTDGFLVATPRPLGYLNYARVWHDNSGKANMGGWYMNYMIVRDVQTDEKWVFIADKWFAVEEDDGQVDRIIPVATKEAMTDFGHMFAERSRKNLADGHLWFSVVARPPASRFTCVQRVSCCLCLLYVSMLANAMFYNTSTEESGTSNGITFGPFSVSPEQIFIGVISNLIVFPVNFIIITLFRKSRPRKLRPSRVDEAIKTAHDGPRTEASVTDIKPEVSSIFSVSRPTSMMANPKPSRPESSLSRPGTSLSTRADATLPTKKKKKKSLPWWCRIVGWVVLWVSTIISMAFVTFYGISFSDEVCKKWISSMLISFFMSVFITQPIKVFMIAIFLSLIIKNPGEEEDEEEEADEEKTKLANDEIPLHDLSPEGYGAARPRKIGYKPPDRNALEAARQKRLNEIQMWAIVREVVIYSFFLWILLVISYRQRNGDTFLYKDTMERIYIKNNETNIDFEKIRNVDEYWTWTRSGMVNGIRAGPYYNDYPPLMLRGYVNDKVSKILGYATMRQLRIRPSLCEMDERMMTVIRECNVGYDIDDQEEGTFDVGWKRQTVNSTANDTAPWYSYTDADSLNGYPYWGQLGVYAGGGYVVPLKGSKDTLISLMTTLEQEKWIDRYTRAVFVEFTTYNAQVNLFGIATILAEFHPTGGVVQSYRFEPAMLLPYMTSAMLFQLVCEATYCFFIIFFIVRLIRTFLKERLAFFKGFWNLVEMGIIAMSMGAIIIYFYRLFETNKLTSRFKETNGLEYIKFQYVGYWNEIFTYMIGWTVFFATLKFMRLLRFNKRMSLLASTLRNGARSLLHFSIIFWIVFLAFSMLFFLSFMTIDIKYSSFIGSVVSGILMMMGKFDIYTMTMAEPVLTQLFVFLFVISVTFIIVNMFVSILNETFSAVRDDVNKQSNDYEIISFMLTRFKRFTGMGTQPQTTLTPEEMRNQELEQRYAEGRGNSCVDDFPERIDRLLHSISNVYMDQDQMHTALLDKRGYQHGAGAKGFDNPGYTGPKSKAGGLSKVHTH